MGVQLLEAVLPPSKLLYLSGAAMTQSCDELSHAIGTVLASFPSALPNYMREVASVWCRYRTAAIKAGAADPVDDVAEAPVDYAAIKIAYVRRVFLACPRLECTPPSIGHCQSLIKLLCKVAATTSFTRTGDTMVHKMILTQVKSQSAAGLSTMDVPFTIAGTEFGEEANRRVRQLFERNVETDFADTPWERTRSPENLIFAASILFETGGDLGTSIACAHEVAHRLDSPVPCVYCWESGEIGILYCKTAFTCRSDLHYPIPALLLHLLEFIAYADIEGSAAARSILCAVKTPSQVGVFFGAILRFPPGHQLTGSPSQPLSSARFRDSLPVIN
jgi:hypothetical protein